MSFGWPTLTTTKASLVLLLALAVPAFAVRRYLRRRSRLSLFEKTGERVLILGGTSGLGRSLAHQYSERGGKVCVVGRRRDELEKVLAECLALRPGSENDGVLIQAGDFTNVDDMIRVRALLQTTWGGLDTLAICAGVSALRPLLEVAGVERHAATEASPEGIHRVVEVSNAALKGNFTGPLVSAVTFIPFLESTSPSPAILLISSLAAVVPAPTRSLYCSTKSASLVLYQSLAIEHPKIAFTFSLPATIEGDFRASAVDGGKPREADPNKTGLKREYVARRCIAAVDAREKVFFMPQLYGRAGHISYWLFPSVVEHVAAKKYHFA